MHEAASTVIFEEHQSVLAHWFENQVRGATVICFDAHLDLQPVSRARLDRLAACGSGDEVRQLAKRHHLLTDDDSSYSIEDFFFAAAKLGLVNHLVWVAPPHVRLEPVDEAIDQFRELPGITTDCLQQINRHRVRDTPCFTTEFWGLRLTVCRREALPALELPGDSLIDIDIDYFIDLPSQQLGETPTSVMASLRASGLASVNATISRSVRSGFTPLRYRFLADWMAAMIQDPSGRSSVAETGRDLALLYHDIDCEHQFIDPPRIDQLSSRTAHPCGAGAVEYALSIACQSIANRGRDPSPFSTRAKDYLAASIRAQNAYATDVVRLASEYPNRQIPIDIERAEALERMLQTPASNPEFTVDQWNVIAASAIGLLWCHLQQFDRAEACYQDAMRSGQPSRELALELAKSFLGRGSPFAAMPYLDDALLDDKTRPTSLFLKAIASRQLGRTGEAETLLETLRELAPAWPDLHSIRN
ncbi:MAG: hypothetical protein AAF745_11290 [Planctomycetota bacterium]